MNIDRYGYQDKFIAVRLHTIAAEMGTHGFVVRDKDIRIAAKNLYHKQFSGSQHFLRPESDSSKPIRNINTIMAKCIFICYKDVSVSTIKALRSGNTCFKCNLS